jgi:hypothetical protein
MWEHNQLTSLFVCLLSAHDLVGLVDDGMQYYVSTIRLHEFCYTCMVDLLGHAGHPLEAGKGAKQCLCMWLGRTIEI